METKNLKSISIAAVIAVVAGVFMLGVNQAFGVDAPSQEPASAGLVSPRFGGIDVEGDVKVTKRIDVTNGLFNSSTGAVKIDDTDGLIVSGNVNISGKLTNSSGGIAVPLTLDDQVDITGSIINSSKSIVSGVTKENPVIINDDLSVSKAIDAKGGIFNSLATLLLDDEVTVTGDIDAKSKIKNTDTGEAVEVSDGLIVTGDIEAKAKIKNSDTGKSVEIDDSLVVTGNATATNVTASKSLKANDLTTVDKVSVGGHLFMNFNTLFLSDDSWIQQTVTGPLSIKAHFGRDLELLSGKTNSSIKLKSDGNVDLKGNLTINGAAKATRFGTYTREISSFAVIGANNIYEANIACPSGTYIVSCGGQGSDSSSYTPTKSVTFSNLDPYIPTNTCYARGVNNSSSNKYVRAIAICLNPAI